MSVTLALGNQLNELEKFFRELPELANEAARFAINDVAEGSAMVLLRKELREDIFFPSGYLETGRLRVSRRATNTRPEAVITARDRATSLARFAPGQTPSTSKNKGVRLQLRRGSRKFMSKAFLMNLKNGNVGLALRLKPGEVVENKTVSTVAFGGGLYLLYGPSVNQVFREVAEDNAPVIGGMVSKRFLHHFSRLSRGKNS